MFGEGERRNVVMDAHEHAGRLIHASAGRLASG
jgi:hypothetical protein